MALRYSLTNPSGGENISSVALEAMLSTHPAILEVGVCAVSDSHWGERPKAFVTTKDGSDSKSLGEEIIQWAKENSHISRFMVPREVVVVKELPKTSTGKVQKNVLREWAKNGVPT
jgi:acyl-CoA synthetase (AMP-forming)/AMP-acid ligase II